MSTSLSPSIGSTTLTCQPQRSGTSNSNMRLPSMEEFLRKTDRLSERNRTFGHINSPSTDIQIPSEGLIDLTSDSQTEPRNLPSLGSRFPNTNLPTTTFPDPNYFAFFDMPQRAARRSRESTVARERPVKRRRVNDLINDFDFDGLLNSYHSDPPPTTSRSSYKPEPIEVPDVPTCRKEEEKDIRSGSISKPEEESEVFEPQNEQDKQLADTIKAQAGLSQGSSKLNQLTCIICMDNMENMTATICGHIFCHTCIMEALLAGENRADGRQAAKCPMCRTKLRRKTPKGPPEVVPLTLKLMRRGDKGKGKQKEVL